jgi:hypothetical protein
MRQRVSVLLPFVVVSLILPTPAQKASNSSAIDGPPAYTISEAYNVYSAILAAQTPYVSEFVVDLETNPYQLCRAPEEELDTSVRAAMVDYSKVNHSKFILLPIFFRVFPVSKPYRLVLRRDLKDNSKIGSEMFGGPDVWSFSAVGFNQDKTTALAYYQHTVTGGILVLQKIRGKWTELGPKAMCRWIS